MYAIVESVVGNCYYFSIVVIQTLALTIAGEKESIIRKFIYLLALI